MKYVLGLDLGVASIGWGCLLLDDNDEIKRILDHGVVTFKALDNDKGQLKNVKRREARGARRIIRRRAERNRRVKKLVVESGLISLEELNLLFNGQNKVQPKNILELKVKGLTQLLTKEELVRCLLHYSNNRGFKSNRKNNSTEDIGKMKNAIGTIKLIMAENNVTVSQAVLMHAQTLPAFKTKNTDDNYEFGYERADVETEIKQLLENQVNNDLISEKFAEEYLTIWSSQRDFSEGPAQGSPYHVSFDTLFGKCQFTKENRISKAAPSFEIFAFLQKLINLRYFVRDQEGKKVEGKLTADQIRKFYKIQTDVKKPKNLTYADILKEINVDGAEIKNLPQNNKKQFIDHLKTYKDKNNIERDVELSDEQYQEVKIIAKNELYRTKFFELKSYNYLLKALKNLNPDDFENLATIENLDIIATVLAYAQTDNAIKKIIDQYYPQLDEKLVQLCLNIKANGNTGTGSLSLSLTQELNKKMMNGMAYEDAMSDLDHDHYKITNQAEFINGFPTVHEIEKAYDTQIMQPNVRHVLVILRKLYNQIVATHGKPYMINIEVATELKNSYSVRLDLQRDQLNNQIKNQEAKVELAKTFGLDKLANRNFKNFSKDDLTRFKLWKEQNEICIYSGEPISKEEVIGSRDCEVDHILPFSKTFDDSYSNKVLVKTRTNQEKKNRSPYQWLKSDRDRWKAFEERVKKSRFISERKKDKLLYAEEIKLEDFTSENLHATAYLSKLAVNIFSDILKQDGLEKNVNAYKGHLTSYLRRYYRLNNLTHSIESPTYDRKDTKYIIQVPELVDKKDKSKCEIKISAKNQYGNVIEYKLSVRMKREKGSEHEFYTEKDKHVYQVITVYKEKFLKFFSEIIGENTDLTELNDYDKLYQYEKEPVLTEVLYDLLVGLSAKVNVKNRDNNFHHTVDALLVASLTKRMQKKITKFHMLAQQKDGKIYDKETEEFYEIKDIKKEFNMDSTLLKNLNYNIPLPYPQFPEDIKFRVFERDEEVLREKLSELDNYDDVDLSTIKVKIPYFYADKKVSGALHKETIYGKKKSQGQEVMTLKTKVENITEKNIENIFEKETGQKVVYEVLKNWINTGKNGKPKLKNGNEIKKVKIVDENTDKYVQISPNTEQKGYAGIGGVARIKIFEKENDQKLYFVQIPISSYFKLKNNDFNFDVQVWWAQGKNNLICKYSELEQLGFKQKLDLFPGQLIEIKTNKSAKTVCKVVGFTGGKLEIGDLIGDDITMVRNDLTGTIGRYLITISTIVDINPIHINITGI